MKMRIFAAALLLAGAVAGEAIAEQATRLPDTSRVVALGGAVTEIVYALGVEDRLVARDSTSIYPDAVFSLPDVGYLRQLSPEGVLSVNPTGIIALEGAGPKETVEVLKKASVPYVEVPETYDHAGILKRIEIVGAALGEEAKAAELSGKVDAELKEAEVLTRDIGERKRVLFILSMQGGKILASGSGTAADGIISLAGAVNAIEGVQGYKQMTDEGVISARPDVVLLMERDGLSWDPEKLFSLPAIASTPAGENRQVIRMNAAYLLGFGPRTASAVRELAVSLYGDALKT